MSIRNIRNDEIVGKVFKNKNGLEFKVIEEVGKHNGTLEYEIQFTESKYERNALKPNILSGNVKDVYHPSVCGIGYLGEIEVADYKELHHYWAILIRKCYSDTKKSKGIELDADWHCFATFADEVCQIKGWDEGLFEDRELKLVIINPSPDGKKIYSRDTCEWRTKDWKAGETGDAAIQNDMEPPPDDDGEIIAGEEEVCSSLDDNPIPPEVEAEGAEAIEEIEAPEDDIAPPAEIEGKKIISADDEGGNDTSLYTPAPPPEVIEEIEAVPSGLETPSANDGEDIVQEELLSPMLEKPVLRDEVTEISVHGVAESGNGTRRYSRDYSEPIDLDLDPLPEMLRNYIKSMSATTDADNSLLVSSTLACCSAFIKRKLYIPEETNGGYFQDLYPNLWNLNLCESGQFKTTALNRGTALALRNDDSLLEKIEQIDQEGMKNDLRRELVLLSNTHTIAGLLEDLATGLGGLIRSSEFGTWFDAMSQNYNAGLQDLFLELYDVPPLFTKKTKTGGLVSVRYPYISIVGATTPVWIRQKISVAQIQSGFLARFLIFYPPKREKVPRALPSETGERVDHTIENEVLETLLAIQQGQERQLFLTEQARRRFECHHRSLYDSSKNFSEKGRATVDPFLKRWSPTLLKLSMIMQVFIDRESNEISIEALDAAKAVIDYSVHSTMVLLEKEINESDCQKKERLVTDYLRNQGGTVRWRKLQQSKRLDGGKNEYMHIVDSLEAAGLVEILKHKKRSDWEIVLVEQN